MLIDIDSLYETKQHYYKMTSYCGFSPEEDLPDLSGKVILITGGMFSLRSQQNRN